MRGPGAVGFDAAETRPFGGLVSEFPYMPLWVDDFLGSNAVASMSTAEVGAYLMLLMRAWKGEPAATIPGDDQTLARWTGMTTDEWSKAKPSVLRPWIAAGNGRFLQPRLKLEWDRVQASSNQKRAAGKSGAQKRWRRDGGAIAPPLAGAWRDDGSSESRVQSPDQNQKAKVTPPPPVGGRTVVSLADTPPGGTDPNPEIRANPEHVRACWNAYPSSGRVGYQRARLAIGGALDVLRLRGESDPAAWLLGRVLAFAASPAGNAGKFTPHAATWFSDGRYDDPPEAWERRVDQATDEPRMTAAKLDAILGSKP